MNFVVGAKEDIDAWAALGNPAWDWESFSRHLRKTYVATMGPGKTIGDGVIRIGVPGEDSKWSRTWRDTIARLGFRSDNDPFSGEISGAVMSPDAIYPPDQDEKLRRQCLPRSRAGAG